MKRIAIVGVGAIGGWLAASLATVPGISLSLLARGHTLDALRSRGLQLERSGPQGGAVITHPLSATLRASDQAADLGEQDVVILTVKTHALAAALGDIAPLLGPRTTVVSAMNGVPWWFLHGLDVPAAQRLPLTSVDPGGRIAAAIPADRVLGAVVHASCSTPGPAQVRHHFGQQLILGEPVGGTSSRLNALVECLTLAGIDAQPSARIQQDIWFKLWGNLTMNPISAITGATTDRILADPLLREFVSRVMLEAKAIGERLGIPIHQAPLDRHAVTLKLGAFKTSMLQDVLAQRPVEIDALVSAVHELGQRVGVDTPFTGALLGLARVHAQTLGLYPRSEEPADPADAG